MRADRRGFTLVELTVVSVLGALVLAAILQVLITNQRTFTAQGAVVEAQQGCRMAIDLLFNELRELSPGDGDIQSMSSTSLEARFMRKFGIACDVEVGPLFPLVTTSTVTVLRHGGEDFAVGDTVVVFAENREATANDDVWIETRVLDSDTSVTCLGGRPANQLEIASSGGIFDNDTIRIGAAVRSYETYRYYRGGWNSQQYLIRQGRDGFPYPMAGPVRLNGGLQFVYRDALGNITTTPEDVRQIEVRIRTGEKAINSLGETVSDSLDAWIFTRN